MRVAIGSSRIALCSLGFSGIHYIDQAGLELLRDSLSSASYIKDVRHCSWFGLFCLLRHGLTECPKLASSLLAVLSSAEPDFSEEARNRFLSEVCSCPS